MCERYGAGQHFICSKNVNRNLFCALFKQASMLGNGKINLRLLRIASKRQRSVYKKKNRFLNCPKDHIFPVLCFQRFAVPVRSNELKYAVFLRGALLRANFRQSAIWLLIEHVHYSVCSSFKA